MPKMKTKRAAAKRFKLTGSGKLMRFNQEEHKEEEKPQKAHSGGRYQHQDNEEDHALSVIQIGSDVYRQVSGSEHDRVHDNRIHKRRNAQFILCLTYNGG